MTRRPIHRGFTLVELMIVASIVAALLVVMVPGIRGLMVVNDKAQSENLLRATVMAARAYAMDKAIVTGIRFQPDGRMVQVYATNMNAGLTLDNFRNARPTYQMVATEGRAPEALSGPWRITTGTYVIASTLDVCTANWWGNERWFLTCVICFAPSGRGIHTRVVFPTGTWYPDATGEFARWNNTGLTTATGTVYQFAGAGGLDWQNNPNLVYGPDVTTYIRMYDYQSIEGMIPQVTCTKSGSYWVTNSVGRAMKGMIGGSACDYYLDTNTGIIQRRSSM